MMNVIEKLQSMQRYVLDYDEGDQYMVESRDGDYVSYDDLRAIIEEAKKQEPVALVQSVKEVMPGHYDAHVTIISKVDVGDKLFTHPQLSDETVKDAKRLDWMQAQSVGDIGWCARLSGTGRGYRLHQDPSNVNGYNVRQAIDEAMKADDVSE